MLNKTSEKLIHQQSATVQFFIRVPSNYNVVCALANLDAVLRDKTGINYIRRFSNTSNAVTTSSDQRAQVCIM